MAAVKALQQWCKIQCNGYRDVSITNMTTSFRDGLAFCALIHKHRPDLINFDSLKKDNVYENNKLAFRVAEEELGIPALLDAEDMVALKVPDRLSILTYVSQYYNYFHGRSPIGGMAGVKRPAEATKDEPSGKKNQPVVSKVFPSSKPATDSLPPPSSQIIKPTSSPKQASRAAQKEVPVEKPHQTGTLSNKCVSCNKHVHLVQRHLVDGKLYHRNCAKSLLPSSTNAPVRELPQHTPIPKYTSHLDPIKANTSTPTPAPSRLGPSWLATKMEKSSPPASTSSSLSTSSPSRPASVFSSPGRGTQTTVFQIPTSTTTTPWTTCDPTITTTSITVRPNASPKTPRDPTFTTSITASPKATPRTSATAAKTQQAKLRFLQSGSDGTSTTEENKTPSKNLDTNTGLKVVNQGQGVRPGQAVSVVVNVAGVSRVTGGDAAKAADLGGGSGKVWTKETSSSSKTQAAAAFISKKLTEENNNNNSKPIWTNVALKKTDKPSQVEPTKKETQGVKGRVRLKVDPSILADLTTHSTMDTPKPTPTPASRTGLGARTPDKGTSTPTSALSNTPAASENSDSPADWRSRLKPVSKETKPAAPSLLLSNKPTDVSPRPWANEAKKSQASDSSAAGPSASHAPSSTTPVTTPASQGSLNGGSSLTANGTKPEQKISKTKPDYIPKEEILKELQQIEDNLNELEKTGVELETRLRRSEEEGEDDSVMDELMVEWFNLIRNKQVAIRRESELVYIARTQDLEEEQPSVEQELRRLMEKPEHLKTFRDRKREEELMTKLVGIVNDRNAIVEGLDEDRLREEEEDEQLNKMMMNLDIKKDKPKKKSPMSKLFNWGNKKDT